MIIDNLNGYIYLLHYREKLSGHAQHYMGWTNNIENRIFEHIEGREKKCKLTYEFAKAGIPFIISKLWFGTRDFERKLKNQRNHPRHCTCCNGNLKNVHPELVHIINDLNKRVLEKRYVIDQ